MLEWSLLSGPAPIVLCLSAIAATGWLISRVALVRRRRPVEAAVVLGCIIAAAVVTALMSHLARSVWMLFPDQLEPAIYSWAATAVFAMAVALTHLVIGRGAGRSVITIVAATIIVAACANQINASYGAYLTPRDIIGGRGDQIALQDVRAPRGLLPDADPAATGWSPPAGLPSRGVLTSATIAPTRSGFAARAARIYLPPAYFTDPRPRLPVLVLLAGQPGGPQDWLGAGKLAQTMNGFAAEHHGLAPVVVVVDGTGTQFGNPLCVDSERGHADTYLAYDVPAWITTHLTVDPDPQGWAIGGLSYGGTCALQLGTNHPEVYPTILDISGQTGPSLGDRERTIAAAFAGDAAALARVNPLDLLRTHRYPGSAVAIVVGSGDRDGTTDAHTVYDATRSAGMDSHYSEVAGSHDWRTFSAALAQELPWIAQHIGLTL